MRRLLVTAVALLFAAPPGLPDVKLPAIFGDHMVLQRDKAVPIWGTAAPNESVTVSLGSATATVVANAEGKWSTKLDSLKLSEQPVTLVVRGANQIEITDVLAGDVWICAGQSNMGWSVVASTTGPEAVQKSADPQLRLFMANASIKFEPQSDNGGKWMLASPASVQNFSAVGYFAGRDLREHLKIPVGLIEESLGGTSAEAWTSQEALTAQPKLKKLMSDFAASKEKDRELTRVYDEKTLPAYQKAMADYRKATADAQKKWLVDAAAAKAAGQPEPPKPVAVGRPAGLKAPPNRLTPTVLFNGMINPILPLAIKGVIWYQGEHNTFNPDPYRTIFPTMIADWRARFGQGDFPFVYCQIADNVPKESGGIAVGNWPFVREVETNGLKTIANSAMVTTIDVGDPKDVHYHNKQPVGQRVALAVEHIAYGEDTPTSGPMMDHVEFNGNTATVSYQFADAGLMVGTPPTDSPFGKPADGPVRGFEMAGEDKVFHPAEATIDGATITVKCSELTKGVALRYGFTDGPAVNLYAKDGLPAVQFRTDSWAK